MKLKKAVVVLMAVGLCMLTGCSNQSYVGKWMVLCQDLVQVKMRNFSHFNLPKAQP